ncbi:hypothetical protein LJC49_11175 [Ruminococcaceae bacterium OttesenSCG-928-I18]|nr:hypothetical protein [Ruminococcaceae bacterium OttesenSCG-928-I18]
MRLTKSLVKTVLGLVFGLLSFLILVPTGHWTWLGLAFALAAVFLGLFSNKRDTKRQEYVSLAGVVLAVVSALLFLGKTLL